MGYREKEIVNTPYQNLNHFVVTDNDEAFYTKLLNGLPIPPNNYTHSRRNELTPAFDWTIKYYGTSYQQPSSTAKSMSIVQVAPYNTVLTSLRNKADLLAVAQLNENASSSSFNLGVTMAEFGKTAALVGTSATRIYHALRMLKKGRLGSAIDALSLSRNDHLPELRRISSNKKLSVDQRLSNQWLELRYGWRPLINDIYSAAEATANLLYLWPYDITVKGYGKDSDSYDAVGAIPSAGGTYRPHHERQFTVKRRYVRHIKVIPPSYRTFNSMGLHNPYLIAWELMPWSFVIDWFLPIGTWLAAAATPALPSAVYGTDSWRTTGFIKKTSNGFFHYDPPNRWYCTNAVHFIELNEYQRSLNTAWPTASFPSISNATWFPERALDAVSLLNSLRGNGSKDPFLKRRY